MSNQPSPTQDLSFDLLSRVNWPSVVQENNPVLWKLIMKHLLEPGLIDDEGYTYSASDEDIGVATTFAWGPEYQRLFGESLLEYFRRIYLMEGADLRFERALHIYSADEEQELDDVLMDDEPEKKPEDVEDNADVEQEDYEEDNNSTHFDNY